MTRQSAMRRSTLNLRIKPAERGLIDRAAAALGKSRTEFMVEASKRAAEDALLDRVLFQVSARNYAAFEQRLDAPPNPNPRLRKTMKATFARDE